MRPRSTGLLLCHPILAGIAFAIVIDTRTGVPPPLPSSDSDELGLRLEPGDAAVVSSQVEAVDAASGHRFAIDVAADDSGASEVRSPGEEQASSPDDLFRVSTVTEDPLLLDSPILIRCSDLRGILPTVEKRSCVGIRVGFELSDPCEIVIDVFQATSGLHLGRSWPTSSNRLYCMATVRLSRSMDFTFHVTDPQGLNIEGARVLSRDFLSAETGWNGVTHLGAAPLQEVYVAAEEYDASLVRIPGGPPCWVEAQLFPETRIRIRTIIRGHGSLDSLVLRTRSPGRLRPAVFDRHGFAPFAESDWDPEPRWEYPSDETFPDATFFELSRALVGGGTILLSRLRVSGQGEAGGAPEAVELRIVDAYGFVLSSKEVRPRTGETIDVEMSAILEPRAIHGIVRSLAGRPIPGAMVQLGGSSRSTMTTDAYGRYRFAHVLGRRGDISAWAGADLHCRQTLAPETISGQVDLVLSEDPRRTVCLRVADFDNGLLLFAFVGRDGELETPALRSFSGTRVFTDVLSRPLSLGVMDGAGRLRTQELPANVTDLVVPSGFLKRKR